MRAECGVRLRILLLALALEVFGIVSPWLMQLVVDHALI